jgi:hypothetical protein
MPDFTPDDIDISPGEFVDACRPRDIDELLNVLVEDGYISADRLTKNGGYKGVRRPNINDEKYWESLQHLAKCRDLLSTSEEEFINNLADRFKYLR